MTKRGFPKVVTANDLFEGDAVWLAPDGSWTREIERAETIWDDARAKALLAGAAAQADQVVGAYLAEVCPDDDGPRPIHFREAFRTRGPSNYFHGKQAGE